MDIWHKLKELKTPIVLYGMGNGGDIMLGEMEKRGIKCDGVFASDDFVRGQYFRGYKVMTFAEAKQKLPDLTVLVSFGTQRPEVIENILSLDAPVFAPEVPVVGEQVFDYEFASKHAKELEEVYACLADEKSKEVFEQIVRYKLDGDIRRLIKCQSDKSEMMSLFALSKNERYLDLGAYNGDTVKEFAETVGSWESITAVEPDKKNFIKLERNTANLPNVKCINKVIDSSCGEIMFSSAGGRNSRVGAGEKREAVSVDSLKEDFTFIKFDVEGQEAKAIKGAEKTIAQRPKMLVSAYHRSEDIFALPLQVLSICPDYKVYLRHQPYIPAWDTNYCFV
ncbi:MAG: FkbM family methyltransferase [Clostridia bacterium]|nr:FkbM family methyltransferase [Clostridia bacterium]